MILVRSRYNFLFLMCIFLFCIISQKQPLEVLYKKVFLHYSQESTCIGAFLNKVAGLQACNFIKKRLLCFSVNICPNFKSTSYEEHLRTADYLSITLLPYRRTLRSETIFDNLKPFENDEKC